MIPEKQPNNVELNNENAHKREINVYNEAKIKTITLTTKIRNFN